MSDSRPAALAAGDQVCMSGTAADHCGAPAVVHILQTDDRGTFGCAAHTRWWIDHPLKDFHPVGSECGMPGMQWMFGPKPGTGYCRVSS